MVEIMDRFSTSLTPHGKHLPAVPVDGHHGRLVQHNTFAFHVHQHVGRTQIDADIAVCRHRCISALSRDGFA